MELEIQQCEKTKAVREEQLERLTQICQEQAVSTNTSEIYFALLTFNWCGKVFSNGDFTVQNFDGLIFCSSACVKLEGH